MKYLLDTTWIVGYLRGNVEVNFTCAGVARGGAGCKYNLTSRAVRRVFRSTRPAANEAALKEFLSAVTVLEITEDICRRYGEEKAILLERGIVIGSLDLLIAATALHHSLTLLTADRDFGRIEKLH